MEDNLTALDTMDSTDAGINWGGLLNKAAETAMDVYAIKQGAGKNATVPGSVYPTGQTNPAVAATQTSNTTLPKAGGIDTKTVLIVGGVLALGLLVVVALKR